MSGEHWDEWRARREAEGVWRVRQAGQEGGQQGQEQQTETKASR